METSVLMQVSREFQVFSAADGLAVVTLTILEGILSVDNSLVLAILVRTLPKEQRKKALMYGIFGAFFFRVVALVFAAHLMRFVAFKIIGGGYLVYLAMKHMFFFYKEDAHQARPKAAASFWRTVLIVEFTDVAFSIDSITTAVAMSDKLLIVWLAGIMGIIFLRFAAGLFIRLLEKLPKLEDLAYQLIFFLGSALVYRDYYQTKTESRFHNRLLTRLKAQEITVDEILALEYIPREIIMYLRDAGVLSVKGKEK